MKRFLKNIGIALFIFLILAGVFSLTVSDERNATEVPLSKVAEEVNADRVERIEVQENQLLVFLKDGNKIVANKETQSDITESLSRLNVKPEALSRVAIEIKGQSTGTFFVNNLLPFLLPFILIAGFIYFLMRQVGGQNNRAMSFGQSQARLTDNAAQKKVTFQDVAGVAEAKEELKEVVEFLRYPQKFLNIGARIPKGVLLLGPPGCGKTLLARAVAGEANVPFFHMSGSEFVEMFVGVGAARTRDLFRKAKKHAPCIVFIDEIDAVGRQRGAGLGGSHDEREQTLNQILVEMDGFDTDTNVIVIAATNRPDVLDPALLRPGRFDRQVIIDQPDIKDRIAILNVHLRGKPIVAGMNVDLIAERTPGFSGADLANLVNEAAILAARRNKKVIDQAEFIEAVEKVMLGPERKSRVLSVREKQIAAYHEGGHALVAAMLPFADPVHKISIVSRGRAAGYTLKLPVEDKHLHSRSEFYADLAVALGGYAAEQQVFGDLTTGASNDLQVASNLARKLVTVYGMSEKIGPISFGDHHEMVFLGKEIGEQRNYSEKVAQKIDEEIASILSDAHKVAEAICKKYSAKLDEIAKVLTKQETIEQEEFVQLMADANPPPKKIQKPAAVIAPPTPELS
ncbi:MAG: cell division protein FtsH [Candidatus Doudnabacteria bacterium RIFCSPHIGHO2_02_FULL_48_21]|uniref:ATP-dependent zinc metalloprotease FtsH n=1 Tax=Candidatus Doudnabacteria bacterium RIFCSPLOWO2_02_FULL_48_13 TaxID=1817845 RepID=A0A1F5QCE7_9BACT|nr:MAG: cell division protein FtsH [Candidatus Doudnabacteria bacterium RIFCSPHIGHO2_01_48_18]OGE79636.1 MAG: cell division protein FtsH [Candidatus Doudnabacteria bacterium RIFCSPHIGHO2_01_FULL_48_180]OGE91890.1 MAG: cell division protein FtsH [Candidatus Doudnabacteria bacterium RIFCSPHIGHO2_12_FULL_47_25]OGE93738.1 MAG: cell division protein FtsH [Candidatus Doudnabacteria bacterium RIFCSPHIGHO2_02_FULL_48_21]OGE97966.1 MAG: cell division protein FtsH [Candidatus Doudnabacteria bacterium RIF